jgi:hypothetical protein
MATETLDATIKARVPKSLALATAKHALKVSRSVSAVTRIALEEYLQREGHRK